MVCMRGGMPLVLTLRLSRLLYLEVFVFHSFDIEISIDELS